ncbi:hypothetical protein D3C72_1869150 [compost metagenome]
MTRIKRSDTTVFHRIIFCGGNKSASNRIIILTELFSIFENHFENHSIWVKVEGFFFVKDQMMTVNKRQPNLTTQKNLLLYFNLCYFFINLIGIYCSEIFSAEAEHSCNIGSVTNASFCQ